MFYLIKILTLGSTGVFDGGGTICVPCHYSCNTCIGISANQCSSCPSLTFKRGNNLPLCPCLDGFFD